MRYAIVVAALAFTPALASARDEEVHGTWTLVSSTRKVLDTGQEFDTYGKHPKGFITYGQDGRMMAMIVYDGRPKPESIEKMTDQQRSELLRSMLAYGGTYKFDGKSITHNIDISWNEVWTGTSQVRDIRKDGDRLIYTTRPAPFSGDGKMSVVTLVWEKVK
jgi:hypothetical protein